MPCLEVLSTLCAHRLTLSHFLQPLPFAGFHGCSAGCSLSCQQSTLWVRHSLHPSPSSSGICWMRHKRSGPLEHPALENKPRKQMHTLSTGNALLPGNIKQLLKVYFWLRHLKHRWSFSVNSHERTPPSLWPVTVKQLLYLMKVCRSLAFLSHKIWSKKMIKNKAIFFWKLQYKWWH